jgi:oligopeptide/dipeptide ABC transporter ATP-binding protein
VLLVSHDIDVVRSVADHVVVLYGGRVLERGPTATVLGDPRSPYTRALLASVPHMDPARRGRPLPTIEGNAFSGVTLGCPFAARCPRALPVCRERFPEVTRVGGGHDVWCFNPPVDDGGDRPVEITPAAVKNEKTRT